MLGLEFKLKINLGLESGLEAKQRIPNLTSTCLFIYLNSDLNSNTKFILYLAQILCLSFIYLLTQTLPLDLFFT